MFLEIVRFECRQQVKSPLFVVVAASFFALAFLGMASENVTIGGGTDNLQLNASYAIIQSHAVLGIFSMLGSGFSIATMWMQRAGQIVSHIMHATQRGVPSARRVRR